MIRWATRRGSPKGSWLARMLERKPLSVVAVALCRATQAPGKSRDFQPPLTIKLGGSIRAYAPPDPSRT